MIRLKLFLAATASLMVSMLLLIQSATAAALSVSTATQYMNGVQVIDGQLYTNRPVAIRSSAGFWTYDQGWTTYNNSVNDGNDQDIEFTLQKNFASNHSVKRYCVTARDLMPYGVTAKLQIWTGEYTISPGYPYGLETDPHDFVTTTPLTNQFTKVCTAWTKIQNPPAGTPTPYQRLAVFGGVVVKQGAVQIRTTSIESF